MKTKFRRVAGYLAALALTLAVTTPCFAASIDQGSNSLRYEPVCDGKAYHELRSHWHGSAFVNGEVYISGGCAWQCVGCNYVMITQGDVTAGIMIGKWAGYGYSAELGTLEYVNVHAEEWGVQYSTTMDGYKFVNAPLR